MKEIIENLIKEALKSLGIEAEKVLVEHPSDLSHGDYSTNAGIKYGHAEDLLQYIVANKPKEIEKIELAGPGFINFHLSKEFFKKSIGEIVEKGSEFGKNKKLKGQKIMVEYTDPNVMKPFHIGHLMSNSIGEAISRIVETNGAEVIRANYYSDSGLNIAKAIWGIQSKRNEMPDESATLSEKAKFMGVSYVSGVVASTHSEEAMNEVKEINKKVFDKSDTEINEIYNIGKKWSADYFNELYKKLGSKFDLLVGESEVAEEGKNIVEENRGKFFETGENGAVVFHGEKYNLHLHTRVFINSEGLPTYEAKELGLTKKKFELYKLDESVVITGNEQNDYFKVVLEALKQVLPDSALKTKHLSHGMLRLTTGKMSSRTGDVITAESLIETVKEKTKGDEGIAIGAIKYMILRQSIGNDIIFDIEKSVSTEGDSGVYLQYAYARTCSILEKANSLTSQVDELEGSEGRETHEIEKLLYRFPEIVERASKEYSPNIITTYLTEIAGSFNNLYANEQIISDTKESAYLIALTRAFNTVMKNGLAILGIPTPERM